MRSIIDKYADGIFITNNDKLDFSVPRLEQTMATGESYEGSFEVFSLRDSYFRAFIYSSSLRLTIKDEEVNGNRVTINYSFDTTGLESGDVIKGDIAVVSDLGEYYLPYVFTISYGVIKSSIGSVRNLFHFANQAQLNFNEAVELFYSQPFSMVFEGNDRVHRGKYRGFSKRKQDEQAVDDFLVSVNKKQPVTLSVEKSVFEFNEVTELLRCEVLLHKNTWGNLEAQLSVDAPFVMLEKDRLRTGDFNKGVHKLVFFIMDDKLHEGRNYARISIKYAQGELNLTIIARMRQRVNALRIERREKKNLNARLVNRYVDFRMKKINVNTWVRESMKIVERMNSLDDKNPTSRLYQAQLLLTQRRDNEAKWILDHVENEMKIAAQNAELYSYYLYLRSLLARDEAITDEMALQVRSFYEQNNTSMPILWTLLYIDEELSSAGTKRIEEIERLFNLGKQSPILYIEAYNYYAQDPVRLMRLSSFEVQVLYFAARHGRLSEELANQMIYLASRLKEFDLMVYRLLSLAYNMRPSLDIVEVLCTLLIKSGITDSKYFEWFARGVAAQLRITRLYEYYMYTIPLDYNGQIPKSVYMYFNFRNDMDWRHMALLFANIIDNRKSDPDTFETYRENMMVFAITQIDEEHIDGNVAKIIEAVIESDLIRPASAPHLAKLLFANEVKVPNESIIRVILIQDQFVKEQSYNVEYGKAYPLIYSHNSILFYEDSKGRRSIVPQENIKKLLNEGVYLPAIRNYVADNVYLSMYLCEGRKRYIVVDDKNVEFCRELADSKEVTEDYKREIRMSLLRYYYDNDQISTMDDFLIHLDVAILTKKDRAEVIKYYVLRGMYDFAYKIISTYGCEEVSAKVCVRICNHIISQKDHIPDGMLIKFCFYAFKLGKYDEITLRYLVDNYDGLTRDLRDIYISARAFDQDRYRLIEKLLVQMMFAGSVISEKDDIFEEYLAAGSLAKIEMAFLSYSAYEYFVKGRLTDERIFSHIVHNYRLSEPINDACRLALLKYYSEDGNNYSKKIAQMLSGFIIDFLHRNIYFKFFEKYKKEVPELLEYTDKVVIEYVTDPDVRVTLHYIMSDETNNEEDYRTEEMRNIFGGVFSREFILFFGETLKYYITELVGDKEILTVSDSVSISDTVTKSDASRYSMINDMVVSKAVRDEDTLQKLMEEYVEADSFARKVFKLR